MNALDISSITFRYEEASDFALKNVSLSVPDGRIQALLGPNGAGKSTLMRIVTGQMRGYTGEVSIFGTKMPDRSALLSIGYAPQPISLYTSLTARENLRFFGAMAGLKEEQIGLRTKNLLERVGLRSCGRSGCHLFRRHAETPESGGGAPAFAEAAAAG